MYPVSDKFMELAQSAGREVFCRIEAGGETYYDDRILEFDFDDVVHPDWFTLGTTCANRFSFSAIYGGELNVRDEVRPYISFDGEEWCPLGVFYVSRRYVRGKSASITCYDKMYSLDMDYLTQLSFPSNTAAVLRDICEGYGLECEDYGAEYDVKEIPEGCSVRDMIGYIAGMNRACAKLDRNGALVMKKYGASVFTLSERNCWGVQRNMGRSAVTCLKANTGAETLISGEGAEVSTIEMYNPLMTSQRLDALYSLMRPFSFYGAEIEMQGLPFLEAGDTISFAEGALLYTLAVGEIEYHYDGGLSAVLYSKNRSYSDAAVHTDDLKAAIEDIKKSMGAFFVKQENETQTAVSEEPVTLADFEFDAGEGVFAQIDVNLTVDNFTADFIIIKAYVNNVEAAHRGVHELGGEGTRALLHYYLLADGLRGGRNSIIITAQTKTGSAYILPKMLHATAVWHGGKGSGAAPRDRLGFSEILGGIPLGDVTLLPAEISAGVSIEGG